MYEWKCQILGWASGKVGPKLENCHLWAIVSIFPKKLRALLYTHFLTKLPLLLCKKS